MDEYQNEENAPVDVEGETTVGDAFNEETLDADAVEGAEVLEINEPNEDEMPPRDDEESVEETADPDSYEPDGSDTSDPEPEENIEGRDSNPAVPPKPVPLVQDNSFVRDGTDPLIGHFARVVSGEHEGRYGVVETVVDVNDSHFPTKVNFRTRDNDSALIVVDYNDLVPAEAGGR